MERRDFLKMSMAAPLVWVEAERKLEKVGLQLYTVRTLMQGDFEGTLRQVAAAGYQEVEFAGYYNRTPAAVRSLIDDLGLAAPSTHVSLQAVREQFDALIEQARVIGHHYLVVPSLPTGERSSADAYRKLADEFNRIGEKCRQAGLQFAYHNHAFEFEVLGGQVPYDILLSETDPGLVTMEVDLFWMISAKHDPLQYFERFPGRFALCHVKDMDDAGNMADVGSGKIDFKAIFARSGQAGFRHYIVEHDRPVAPVPSIEASRRYLQQLRF